MHQINIKPLSLNKAYSGRRFKSKELEMYKKELSYLLPKKSKLTGELSVKIVFGFSSKGSDIDNCVKCFLDALSENYGFNDNRVYKLEVEKVDVVKGQEYICFEIESML